MEQMILRKLREDEMNLLKDFLYEAIFVPEGMAQPEIVQSCQAPFLLSKCISGVSVFLLRVPLSHIIPCLSSAFITDKLLVLKSSLEEHNILCKETCQKKLMLFL